MNVHKTFRRRPGRFLNVLYTFNRRPGRLLNVLCTFNLRPVSTLENQKLQNTLRVASDVQLEM